MDLKSVKSAMKEAMKSQSQKKEEAIQDAGWKENGKDEKGNKMWMHEDAGQDGLSTDAAHMYYAREQRKNQKRSVATPQ